MKLNAPIFSTILLFAVTVAVAQDSVNFPTLGSIQKFDPRLDDLIAADAEIEVLSSGFAWSEGPTWVKDGDYLLFSDVHRNRIIKWKEGEGASVFMEPSGYTGLARDIRAPGSNGLAMDADGHLVLCEHGDRRVAVLTKGGGKRTLADNFQGKRFNSPNDLAIASGGGIYFTDPPYGLPNRYENPTSELGFAGIYLLRTNGDVELLTDELPWPNGVALSPDEKMLYVAQSNRNNPIVKQYPIKNDGTIKKGSVVYNFAKEAEQYAGLPDGLKTDQLGNIWTTGPGGVIILSPQGEKLGHILTGERTANCAWGDDGSTLYITADTYLCRLKTKVKGTGF